jgi:hypothetical protein
MFKFVIAALIAASVIGTALTTEARPYRSCNTSCYGNSCTTTCY